MRRLVLVIAALTAVIWSGSLLEPAVADGIAVPNHHATKAKRVCQGPGCGPYAPCVGGRCEAWCPDGASCSPLYGAYGPWGGVGYWGGYTLSGWGPRW